MTCALVGDGSFWRQVRVVGETGSTNADAAAAARAGAPEGLVVAAEAQTAGRGRLGRTWTSPPRAGLTFSFLLRPAGIPAEAWGWLPLLTGVAAAWAVTRLALVEVRLKWPNDLLLAGRKLGGILTERVNASAAVSGLGLNVTTRRAELPVPGATSLVLEGAATTDRDQLLRSVLDEVARWYAVWRAAGGDADRCGLRPAYLGLCATLGRPVRVGLPSGHVVEGVGDAVDPLGRLAVRTPGGTVTMVSAGDVIHAKTEGWSHSS